MKKFLVALLLGSFLAAPALASIDTYEFANKADQERYRKLIEQLRCPKCQNQNIADSNAEISLDMRDMTYQMMFEQQRSDEEIVGYLVERYGDFVRYKPPVDKRTLLLWYGPFVLLAVALLSLLMIVLRRRRQVVGTQNDGLSEQERQRIAQLIEQTRDSK